MEQKVIINSNTATDISNWIIIDDGVMGGTSNGNIKLNTDNHISFYGTISLENNGGFSSVRYRGAVVNSKGYSRITLRLKGDGKRYQFRVKENSNQRHSYVSYFTTSGNWETITFPLHSLLPKFRGRTLDIPNFSGDTISEIGFLVGNKKVENFELIIDNVALVQLKKYSF